MTDTKDKSSPLTDGFNLICSQARLIAMLPIEDWLEALEHAEAIGPFIDPTKYRQYLYSEKPEIIKKILRAALELKRVMEEVQPAARREMEKEQKGEWQRP
jgi:hypothetical protein